MGKKCERATVIPHSPQASDGKSTKTAPSRQQTAPQTANSYLDQGAAPRWGVVGCGAGVQGPTAHEKLQCNRSTKNQWLEMVGFGQKLV